jgi:hypothetical protein
VYNNAPVVIEVYLYIVLQTLCVQNIIDEYPVTVGVTASRNMYSHDRNLTDFFSYMARENTPHFAASPYVSIGINYKYN